MGAANAIALAHTFLREHARAMPVDQSAGWAARGFETIVSSLDAANSGGHHSESVNAGQL